MEKKIPYESPEIWVMNVAKDVITESIVDNDGDYNDWGNEGAW